MRPFFFRALAALAIVALLLTLGWPLRPREITRQVAQHANQAKREPTEATDPPASPIARALAAIHDDPESAHPIESAVACGTVLETRIEPGASPGEWRRIRLVQTPVQPGRTVRVVERWRVRDNGAAENLRRDMFLADQLIVGVSDRAPASEVREQLAALGATEIRSIKPDLYVVRLPTATLDATDDAARQLAQRSDVIRTAEPDGVGFGGGVPNDTYFANQWGWHNTGQTGSGGVVGTVNADVDAPEFWDIAGDASGVTIAVLDSGLNLTHPDLAGVAWTNPGEIAGDGLDNDGNGKIDDVVGWDWVNSDNDPTDDHGHGTNVTGIMVALRDNGIGTAGLISGAKILVAKILNASNSGFTSHLIAATAYARERGMRIMNLSLQSYPYSASLDTEFSACQSAGILLSICAGNQGADNDSTPNYPSSYPHAAIIAVGNHDRTDQRWSGSFGPSNYGVTSVDLFAPGREIYSTGLNTGYSNYTGTSQATPAVTAVAAAMLATNPTWSAPEIKNAILSSAVTSSAYAGICTTGGKLNAVAALGSAVRQLADRDSDGDGFANLVEYLAGTRLESGAQFPALTTETVDGDLRLRAPRVVRADARFEIETSVDLVTWSTAGVTDESSPTEVIGRVPFPTNVDPPRVFLRLKAVGTP